MPTNSGTNKRGIYLRKSSQMSFTHSFLIILVCNSIARTTMPNIGAGNAMFSLTRHQLQTNWIKHNIAKPNNSLKILIAYSSVSIGSSGFGTSTL